MQMIDHSPTPTLHVTSPPKLGSSEADTRNRSRTAGTHTLL